MHHASSDLGGGYTTFHIHTYKHSLVLETSRDNGTERHILVDRDQHDLQPKAMNVRWERAMETLLGRRKEEREEDTYIPTYSTRVSKVRTCRIIA